jgi:uncharacterized protein YkwD
LHSIQNMRHAARRAPTTLVSGLRRHRALFHVVIAAALLLTALTLSLQGVVARPTPDATRPASILPENIGIGVPTSNPVRVTFDMPMNRESVEGALVLVPSSGWRAAWSNDSRILSLVPTSRWMTDARYEIHIGGSATQQDGVPFVSPRRLSFTTETAPVVTDFQLYYAEEEPADRVRARTQAEADSATTATPVEPVSQDTATDVSAATRVTLGFSTTMNQSDVERRFSIRPFVPGTMSWEGNALVFEPSQHLDSGARYAVSVVGAHDLHGNRLSGDVSFSFTVRPGAQVVKVSPQGGAKDVTPANIQVWFSQPMETAATADAFSLTDTTAKAVVAGSVAWNTAGTQLTFTPRSALTRGHAFKIALGVGARDLDRNAVTAEYAFTTKAPPPPPAPIRPTGPPAPSDVLQYALWQINQSRAAYGFAPLVLDAAITKEATAYAWDLMNYNYFSHVGRDGSHVEDRLRRAGISFSWSGENLCYLNGGGGVKATLNWCHSVFMSEPYPGYANHKGNILGPDYKRVGIGIAISGTRIKIVWDFVG